MEEKGGGILTGGLLLICQFNDQTQGDEPARPGSLLHVFDQQTGALVTQIPLDGYALGTPMT